MAVTKYPLRTPMSFYPYFCTIQDELILNEDVWRRFAVTNAKKPTAQRAKNAIDPQHSGKKIHRGQHQKGLSEITTPSNARSKTMNPNAAAALLML